MLCLRIFYIIFFMCAVFFFNDTETNEIYTYCHTLSRLDALPIDRLRRIGWTKLALLAPHIDANNAGDWLKLAEGVTAHELKMHVRGANFDPDTRAEIGRAHV